MEDFCSADSNWTLLLAVTLLPSYCYSRSKRSRGRESWAGQTRVLLYIRDITIKRFADLRLLASLVVYVGGSGSVLWCHVLDFLVWCVVLVHLSLNS